MPTPQSHPESWDLFRECRPFTALPPAALREMFATAEERTYQAGDALLRQGDPGDALLVLLEGSARARLRDEHGSHWVGRFTSGDVVGEMALVTREPRTADVIAESPVRVLLLPTATFDRLATRHLELCMVLTNVVADRLGQGARDGLGGKVVDAFRIVRCVGRGGMAVVYEAVEETTGERVALKMMSHRLIYDSAALARFRQEAELVRSLEHENIARLQRLFPAYGTYFLVMEFCDGADLNQLVKARGPLPEAQVRAILGQLARALDYVHRRGAVHRDLKPGNVMVTRAGTVKLMDFGLAAPAAGLDDATRTVEHGLVGTPAFMAPEQLSAGPLDGRTDIYALACVAFELLTGRHLFPATNLLGMVRDKLTLPLPPAAEIGNGISGDLHDFLARALQVDRDLRPPSVAPLIEWAARVDALPEERTDQPAPV